MAKTSKKLSWSDTKELAFRLIDEHPQVNPTRLSAEELIDLVKDLPDFGERSKKPSMEVLEDLQARWFEERSDMEDELGPLSQAVGDDLDEEEYRDDQLAEDSEDEESLGFEEPYSEDDDEDEEY